jgi:hypothetical protein
VLKQVPLDFQYKVADADAFGGSACASVTAGIQCAIGHLQATFDVYHAVLSCVPGRALDAKSMSVRVEHRGRLAPKKICLGGRNFSIVMI